MDWSQFPEVEEHQITVLWLERAELLNSDRHEVFPDRDGFVMCEDKDCERGLIDITGMVVDMVKQRQTELIDRAVVCPGHEPSIRGQKPHRCRHGFQVTIRLRYKEA